MILVKKYKLGFTAYVHTSSFIFFIESSGCHLSVAYYSKCFEHYVFSGQLDTEHNSRLAVTIYLEHKAGNALTWGLPNLILSCWILLFEYWLEEHKTNTNQNILQVFAFVAAEYETSKNSLNQVWIYFALCGSCVLMPLMLDEDILCWHAMYLTFSQVSLWDAIIPEKEEANFWIQISNKYRFIDQVYISKETYRTLTGGGKRVSLICCC